MNKEIEKRRNDCFQNSRFALISLFELVIFSIFLTLIIIASTTTPFTTKIPNVSLHQQEMRAVAIFFGYSFLTTYIGFIMKTCLDKKNSKIENITIGLGMIPIIGIANTIYFFIKSISEKQLINYIKHIFSPIDTNKKISYKHMLTTIKNKDIRKNDHLFWMTFIFTIVFLVTVVSLIFIFLTLDVQEDPINDPRTLWWFRKFSFFTEWSNFSCFLVCFLFLLNHRWKIFDNGKFMNYIAIYILFVLIVFWTVLLPGAVIINGVPHVKTDKINGIISTGWFHLITPVAYVLFVAFYNYFWIDYRNLKITNYYKTVFYFPLTYCFYTYTLPFIANISVYGLMTNTNPNNAPFGDQVTINGEKVARAGEYWHFVFIPLLLLVFSFLVWAFIAISKKISIRKYNQNISSIQS